MSVGRANSSWGEEERKTCVLEVLLGRFAQGGTAMIAHCNARLLQPGGVPAGVCNSLLVIPASEVAKMMHGFLLKVEKV